MESLSRAWVAARARRGARNILARTVPIGTDDNGIALRVASVAMATPRRAAREEATAHADLPPFAHHHVIALREMRAKSHSKRPV